MPQTNKTYAAVSNLPEDLQKAMQEAGMWQASCPVPLERLSLVRIAYVDFENKGHGDGQLVCLDAVAHQVAAIFDKLLEMEFPIHKIRSVHHYDGDDERSMADNNTSCFNYRPIKGTPYISMHSYGVSIDLNPLQNPFLSIDEKNGKAEIQPPEGWQYLNRSNKKRGMVEELVPLFAEHGFFVWGGKWTTPIDWHHFQPPRGVAELLMEMDAETGGKFFDLCTTHRDALAAFPWGDKLAPAIALVRKDVQAFLSGFPGNVVCA